MPTSGPPGAPLCEDGRQQRFERRRSTGASSVRHRRPNSPSAELPVGGAAAGAACEASGEMEHRVKGRRLARPEQGGELGEQIR
ncbi:hypothetical protein ACWD3I_25000 [Streptomyces sp. NPDC002817]|uniref:hypothetical protein n=1 Tax=Streptomyces sp. NPDC088357 TaxID=3154655 RepID=UPI003418BEF9